MVCRMGGNESCIYRRTLGCFNDLDEHIKRKDVQSLR